MYCTTKDLLNCSTTDCISTEKTKYNIAFEKSGGWKTSFLLGTGLFSGAMLNFGRVPNDRYLKLGNSMIATLTRRASMGITFTFGKLSGMKKKIS